MSTVILKWNPSFSSYTMLDYLYDLHKITIDTKEVETFNWSVWDYDKIHKGDRYYWVKLGYGAVGIVSGGTIISEPYLGEDWSGQGRKTYYVDFMPEVMLNPDTLPILTSGDLAQAIPEIDWYKGRSGIVLENHLAARVEELWQTFMHRYDAFFAKVIENHPVGQLYLDLKNE